MHDPYIVQCRCFMKKGCIDKFEGVACVYQVMISKDEDIEQWEWVHCIVQRSLVDFMMDIMVDQVDTSVKG